jgi:hypothetical protein
MNFNYETLKGLIDRGIVALIGWAVGAGYVPADLVGALTPVLMGIPPLIFAWWFNRPASLDAAAKSVK